MPSLNIQTIEDMVINPPPVMVELISDGILLEGTKLIIYGEPKTYKSLIAQQLAFNLATGSHWLGFGTTPCKVLYVQGEIAKPAFWGRVTSMLPNFPLVAPNGAGILPMQTLYFASVFGLKLDRGPDGKQLQQDVARVRPKVLILDPLYKFMSSRTEESIQATTDILDYLIGTYNMSVIIVAHSRKPKTDYKGATIDQGGSELAGALLEAWADGLIRIRGDISTIYRYMSFELRHGKRHLPTLQVYLDQARMLFQPVP